jgi:thiol-disulfide isomerase/thioredoxin
MVACYVTKLSEHRNFIWQDHMAIVIVAASVLALAVYTRNFLSAIIGGVIGFFPGSYIGEHLSKPAEPLAIAGPTLEGGQFDIQQYRGKVVLVDFWATWCGPCLVEIPNIKRVYNRHHTEGFEVVGVSLDTERERLANFVTTRKIPWPQIFFEPYGLNGWNNPLARKYEVNAIPRTFLVDREGHLVDGEFRGDELEPAVVKLLAVTVLEQPTPGSLRATLASLPLGEILGAFLSAMVGALTAVGIARGFRRLLGPPPGPGSPAAT